MKISRDILDHVNGILSFRPVETAIVYPRAGITDAPEKRYVQQISHGYPNEDVDDQVSENEDYPSEDTPNVFDCDRYCDDSDNLQCQLGSHLQGHQGQLSLFRSR